MSTLRNLRKLVFILLLLNSSAFPKETTINFLSNQTFVEESFKGESVYCIEKQVKNGLTNSQSNSEKILDGIIASIAISFIGAVYICICLAFSLIL